MEYFVKFSQMKIKFELFVIAQTDTYVAFLFTYLPLSKMVGPIHKKWSPASLRAGKYPVLSVSLGLPRSSEIDSDQCGNYNLFDELMELNWSRFTLRCF